MGGTQQISDRHELYELCVTNPGPLARFLRTVHGGRGGILREDFAGSGSLARAWAREHGPAIAVDRERVPLEHCKRQLAASPPEHPVTVIRSDVLRCHFPADIIAATNFPLGYMHTRRALLAYLRHARKCLRTGGVLVADMYGGEDAFTSLKSSRIVRGKSGERIEYIWEQCTASAHRGRVSNAMHFAITAKGSRSPVVVPNAFTYDWRLWGLPELTDACLDAGFRRVEVYDRLGDAIDQDGKLYAKPLGESDSLDDNWVVYVVARR